MKFSIKDFFSKCGQIRSFLQIWSQFLKKSLLEKFVFCAVLQPDQNKPSKISFFPMRQYSVTAFLLTHSWWFFFWSFTFNIVLFFKNKNKTVLQTILNLQWKLTVKGQLIRGMRLWIPNTSKIAIISSSIHGNIVENKKNLIEPSTNQDHLLASLHPAVMHQVKNNST